MKTLMLIFVFLLLAIWGCDDDSDFYEHEFVVSEDCAKGDMDGGIEFDSHSVRCGRDEPVYFGIEWYYYTEDYMRSDNSNPVDLYLYSSKDFRTSKDSVWILETDSAKISTCEKLNFSSKNLEGTFCLNKFENSTGRDYVSYYDDRDGSTRKLAHYFIYSKFESYKAFCVIASHSCVLLYSCIIQDDGSYLFSREPTLENMDRKHLGCKDLLLSKRKKL